MYSFWNIAFYCVWIISRIWLPEREFRCHLSHFTISSAQTSKIFCFFLNVLRRQWIKTTFSSFVFLFKDCLRVRYRRLRCCHSSWCTTATTHRTHCPSCQCWIRTIDQRSRWTRLESIIIVRLWVSLITVWLRKIHFYELIFKNDHCCLSAVITAVSVAVIMVVLAHTTEDIHTHTHHMVRNSFLLVWNLITLVTSKRKRSFLNTVNVASGYGYPGYGYGYYSSFPYSRGK